MRGTVLLIALVGGCAFERGRAPGSATSDAGGDAEAPTGDSAGDASGASARACTFHLGSDHSCAIRAADGTFWCVGLNGFGELGRGTAGGSSTSLQQVDVGAAGVTTASSRNYHTCVGIADGTVRCWGYNDGGQLGDNTTTTRAAPVVVMNLADVVEVAIARAFSCARKSDGTITCWGENADGQLGDGTTTDQRRPATSVTGLPAAPVAIAAGSSHACARFGDGTGACWGRNAFGQLGDGTQTNRTSAVPAPVTNIVQLARAATRRERARAVRPARCSRPAASRAGGRTTSVSSATVRPLRRRACRP